MATPPTDDQRAALRAALTQLTAALGVPDPDDLQLPDDLDPDRLAALQATGLMDSAPDPGFDRLAGLAAEMIDAPVALVSLVGEDRQFFKSCIGLPEPWSERRETPLSHSFCTPASLRLALRLSL